MNLSEIVDMLPLWRIKYKDKIKKGWKRGYIGNGFWLYDPKLVKYPTIDTWAVDKTAINLGERFIKK